MSTSPSASKRKRRCGAAPKYRLTQPENADFWSSEGKDFEADFEALEKLAESGRLRDDATGVCLKINEFP